MIVAQEQPGENFVRQNVCVGLVDLDLKKGYVSNRSGGGCNLVPQ
jgi:hypothetical protein